MKSGSLHRWLRVTFLTSIFTSSNIEKGEIFIRKHNKKNKDINSKKFLWRHRHSTQVSSLPSPFSHIFLLLSIYAYIHIYTCMYLCVHVWMCACSYVDETMFALIFYMENTLKSGDFLIMKSSFRRLSRYNAAVFLCFFLLLFLD